MTVCQVSIVNMCHIYVNLSIVDVCNLINIKLVNS